MARITQRLLWISRIYLTILLSCLVLVIISLSIGQARHSPVVSFATSLGNGDYHLHLLDIDLGRTYQLSDDSIFCCHAWSPNGQQIIFVQSNSQGTAPKKQLYIMNADGSDLHPLTPASAPDSISPDWSPDGSAVVYVTVPLRQDSDIAVLNTQTGITHLLTQNNRDDNAPQWSSDGRFIVFRSQSENGIWDIYRVSPRGEDMQKLTDSQANNLFPSISPDSRRIAFVSNRAGNQDLYVMNADGTNLQQLTWTEDLEMTPVWSPDGARILFQSQPQGASASDIYVIDADGRNPHQLMTSTTPTLFSTGFWSPDSQHFLFLSENTTGGIDISIMDIGGTQEQRLTNTMQLITDLAWQPG